MFFGPGEKDCMDCTNIGGEYVCTMNCGPRLLPHGTAPRDVWLFFPHDGGAPVLWIEPCPFPADDATVVRYRAMPKDNPDGR